MKKYNVTLKHDKGEVTVSVWASNPHNSGEIARTAEKAPQSAIIKIEEA